MTEDAAQSLPNGPPSPQLSISSVPAPKRSRRQSTGEFPPPIRRTATDATGVPRPVPFARKFQRVHPGTTGVTVLEHLERLDAVEQSLSRLGSDETEEEVDVVEAVSFAKSKAPGLNILQGASSAPVASVATPFTPPGSPPLPTVPEIQSRRSSIDEEDLVALSKSTSHVEGHRRQLTSLSTGGIDWIHTAESPTKGKVVAEVCQISLLQELYVLTNIQRLETVKHQPLCACW